MYFYCRPSRCCKTDPSILFSWQVTIGLPNRNPQPRKATPPQRRGTCSIKTAGRALGTEKSETITAHRTGVLTPSVPAPRGVGRRRRADQLLNRTGTSRCTPSRPRAEAEGLRPRGRRVRTMSTVMLEAWREVSDFFCWSGRCWRMAKVLIRWQFKVEHEYVNEGKLHCWDGRCFGGDFGEKDDCGELWKRPRKS